MTQDYGGPVQGSASGEPETAAILAHWRRALPLDRDLPEDEAGLVVEAVLADQHGASTEGLEVAGRSWGRAHLSVGEMVERLSRLRSTLLISNIVDHARMHGALDRVTRAASEEVIARVERLSRTDALTGVGNRRAFDETIQWALSASTRQGHDVTVVVVDVDGLKQINDSQGHAAGDAVLISLVKAFYDTLRDEDMMFRVGGDEFVVVLPFTSVTDAEPLMRRVQSEAPAFTWGAAGHPRDGSEAAQLVAAADADMYRRRGSARAHSPLRSFPAKTAPTPAGPKRPVRALRPEWLAPAAVIVAALVVTFLHIGSAPSRVSAQRASGNRATASVGDRAARHGGRQISSSPPGDPTTFGSAGEAPQAGGGVYPTGGGQGELLSESLPGISGDYSTIPAGADQGSGTQGSGPQGSGPGAGAQAPGPGPGGVVGSTGNLLAPVPGGGGVVQVVDQLLVGSNPGPGSALPANPTRLNSEGYQPASSQPTLLEALGGL